MGDSAKKGPSSLSDIPISILLRRVIVIQEYPKYYSFYNHRFRDPFPGVSFSRNFCEMHPFMLFQIKLYGLCMVFIFQNQGVVD
jgi:hypothetical protein